MIDDEKRNRLGEEIERKKEFYSIEESRNRARVGERFICKGVVKTNGFDGTVAFMTAFMEQLYHMTSKYQSFRMELLYDAKALNTDYFFFVPITECGSDDIEEGCQAD